MVSVFLSRELKVDHVRFIDLSILRKKIQKNPLTFWGSFFLFSPSTFCPHFFQLPFPTTNFYSFSLLTFLLPSFVLLFSEWLSPLIEFNLLGVSWASTSAEDRQENKPRLMVVV